MPKGSSKNPTKKMPLVGAILKEHFQAYVLIAFDLDGNAVRFCDYETEIQALALAEAVKTELNQRSQAQEVWVRNLGD